MRKSPQNYGINQNVEEFIRKNCYQATLKLAELNIVNFDVETERVTPKPISNSISKNAVEIRSIALVIE